MKIKHSIFIIMLLFSIVPLVLWSYFSIANHDATVEKIIEENVKLSTTMQVNSIDSFFEEQDRTLDIIIDYQLVLDLITQGSLLESETHTQSRIYMDNILKSRMNKNKYLDSLTILDNEFKILSCSEKTRKGEISVFKDFQKKLNKTETTFFQANSPNAKNASKKSIIGAKPIYQKDKLVGYIIEEINLIFFEELRLSANVFDNL